MAFLLVGGISHGWTRDAADKNLEKREEPEAILFCNMSFSTVYTWTCVDSNSKDLVLVFRLNPIRESLCSSVAKLKVFRSLVRSATDGHGMPRIRTLENCQIARNLVLLYGPFYFTYIDLCRFQF